MPGQAAKPASVVGAGRGKALQPGQRSPRGGVQGAGGQFDRFGPPVRPGRREHDCHVRRHAGARVAVDAAPRVRFRPVRSHQCRRCEQGQHLAQPGLGEARVKQEQGGSSAVGCLDKRRKGKLGQEGRVEVTIAHGRKVNRQIRNASGAGKHSAGKHSAGKHKGGTVINWQSSGPGPDQEYTDILYATAEGIAKITINRPEVRNAFRPTTLFELQHAFNVARDDPEIGVIILTGAGDEAFCSGGDQRIRGDDGYVGPDGIGRLNVLDLQVQIRRTPKPVIAMVAGYAIGGGHVLHVCCDLTIAADNAIFGQTGPKGGSFDGGSGSWLLAATVGLKKAREIWYLCRQYDAQQALEMGLVNTVVPLASLEEETVSWAREMLTKSPLALRMLKGALNAVTDGAAGMQQFAGDATMLYYMSEEAQEGRNAYVANPPRAFSQSPRRPWRRTRCWPVPRRSGRTCSGRRGPSPFRCRRASAASP